MVRPLRGQSGECRYGTGETKSPPLHIGPLDGPGAEGCTGTGTWQRLRTVETRESSAARVRNSAFGRPACHGGGDPHAHGDIEWRPSSPPLRSPTNPPPPTSSAKALVGGWQHLRILNRSSARQCCGARNPGRDGATADSRRASPRNRGFRSAASPLPERLPPAPNTTDASAVGTGTEGVAVFILSRTAIPLVSHPLARTPVPISAGTLTTTGRTATGTRTHTVAWPPMRTQRPTCALPRCCRTLLHLRARRPLLPAPHR